MQEKQRIQMETDRFEAERIAASAQVFADGPSTVRFATPVEKVATVAYSTHPTCRWARLLVT